MALLLDIGTGAAMPLSTTPQPGLSFFLSPAAGEMLHLSVVLSFSGGVLPPDILVAIQAQADDGISFANVATFRYGNISSTGQVQLLSRQSFAATEGDRTEFLLIPSIRINRQWQAVAWTSSAPQTGHRVSIYSDIAVTLESLQILET